MSNTHTLPDVAYELQVTCQDLLPACIISTTPPAVPGSGLVLAAFATQGYVVDGEALVFVDQPAISLTLSGSAGNYWLALHRDVSTAVAGWTRRAGSHYLWQTAGTQPANPSGGLCFCQVVVTGVNITAVTPIAAVQRGAAWRTLAGLGTMAVQNANAVAITGGTAVLATVRVTDRLGINEVANADRRLGITYTRNVQNALVIRPSEDAGNFAVLFLNAAGTAVGAISTTGAATAYNTTSDARLKHAIAPLTGALDVVRQINPVRFRWRADDSQGEGFLGHELQQVVPNAVTGQPDAVNDDGSINPLQVDYSKLVPILAAAVKELLARVEVLEQALA